MFKKSRAVIETPRIKTTILLTICSFITAFQNIYDRLDITLKEFGESFYHERMIAVVEHLKKGSKEIDLNHVVLVHIKYLNRLHGG